MCQALNCVFYVLSHLKFQTTLQSKCLFKVSGEKWQKWNSHLGFSNSKGYALFTNNKMFHQINNVWLKTIQNKISVVIQTNSFVDPLVPFSN